MIGLPPSVAIYLCNAPVDMRNGFDGLATLVRNSLGLDPLSGHLFLFLSRRRDRAKILFWDKDGYALFYKRLERGRFHTPRVERAPDGRCVARLASREMAMLLEGVDFKETRRRKRFAIPTAV